MTERLLSRYPGYGLGDSPRPLISVIIPAYNAEKYIRRTLKSVLTQTYPNLQIIVVNDGSTDNTADYVKNMRIKDPRILQINMENNQGVSSARNRGLLAARGQFVAFVDADDLLEANCFEEATKLITKNTEYDCVFWRYDLVDEEGHYISKAVYDKTTQQLIQKSPLLEGCRALELMVKKKLWIWTCTIMIRRKTLLDNQIMWTTGCPYGEDQEFILKCLSLSGWLSLLIKFFHIIRSANALHYIQIQC